MRTFNICIATLILAAGTASLAHAFPKGPHHLQLGLRPTFSTEKYYVRPSLDLNAVPLVIEVALTRHLGFRALPIVNLHLNPNEKPQLAHLGAQLQLPIYILGSTPKRPYRALYLAPVLGYSKDHLMKRATFTGAAELGVSIAPANRLSINISTQLGTTWFHSLQSRPSFHFGVQASVGLWLF